MRKIILTLFLVSSWLLAGPFDLKTVDGEKIAMQNFEGNFLFDDPKYKSGKLIFFFFGTHCPYCEADLPKIEKMYADGRLEVIGVEAQTKVSDSALRRFIGKKHIKFRVLDRSSADRLIGYLDSRHILPAAVPAYIWVDKYGNLEPLDFAELKKVR